MKNEENNNTQNQELNGESKRGGLSSAPSSQANMGASVQRAKEKGSDGSSETENFEGVGSMIKDSAQGLLDKAKDTAGQAYEMATEHAASKLEEQKATLTSGLSSVAGSIKQVGESLREADEQTPITELTANYGERLAGGVEQLASYFEENDLRAMASDVEKFARKNPLVFLGGAFALGILAARFLKSSSFISAGTQSDGTNTAKKTKTGSRQKSSDNIVSFENGASNKTTPSAKDSGSTSI
jgi:ElaB/YqjD/DUF883 family membrane-anchored ribosome-binding protein